MSRESGIVPKTRSEHSQSALLPPLAGMGLIGDIVYHCTFNEDVSITALEAFVAVAHERQFKAAARKLNIPQPTLSRYVRKLENAFGQMLLHRSSTGIELTPIGKKVLEALCDILYALRRIKVRVTQEFCDTTSCVKLGTIESVATYWMPSLSPIISSRLPDVALQLHTAPVSSQLELMVANGDIDMAITNGTRVSRDDLIRTVLWKEDYVLCVPHTHHLSMRTSVSLDEIAHEPFIVSPACWGFTPIEEACARKGYVPNIRVKADNLPVVQQMVENGVGLAMMPRVVVTNRAVWRAAIVELEDDLSSRTVVLLHRGSDMLNRAAREICDLLIEHRSIAPMMQSKQTFHRAI